MTDSIDEVKQSVRAALRRDFEPVPAPSGRSGKVHLEVWVGKDSRRPVGVELDHADRVNLWVRTAGDVPAGLSPSTDRTDKTPSGRGWTDVNGDGANSNLSSYDEFRTRKITRLGVKSEAEASQVLEHLTR